MLGLSVCIITGCVSRGNVDLLEAQLREQESLIQQYQQELRSIGNQLTVTQRENDILRKTMAGTDLPVREEATHKLAAVVGIRFNTMLTSGQDRDGLPGDERLHAVLYPHDADGEIVKLSGDLELEAFDPSLPEEERSVGKWSFPADQSREIWHAGFLASGFQFDLPWERSPRGNNVVLHARLKTLDGREFKATHTVPLQGVPASAETGDAPQLVAPPAEAQPLPTETAADGVEWQDRPVPRPEPLDGFVPLPPKAPEQQTPPDQPDTFRGASPTDADVRPAARPFPHGLRTSDVWRDDNIPFQR